MPGRVAWIAEATHDLEAERSFFGHVARGGVLLEEMPPLYDLDAAIQWCAARADRIYIRLGIDATTYELAVANELTGGGGYPPFPPSAAELARIGKELASFKADRRQASR